MDHPGSVIWVPGLEHLQFNIFCFINGTYDQIEVPYSGLAGDYEGAS